MPHWSLHTFLHYRHPLALPNKKGAFVDLHLRMRGRLVLLSEQCSNRDSLSSELNLAFDTDRHKAVMIHENTERSRG